MQWPVGHVSHRFDRGWVLLWVCLACALVAATDWSLAGEHEDSLIFLGVLFGGPSFTVYGLSTAHANDLVDPNRVLEVTGGLLLHGLGATAGPTLGDAKIELFSLESLMLYFAAVLVLVLVLVALSI